MRPRRHGTKPVTQQFSLVRSHGRLEARMDAPDPAQADELVRWLKKHFGAKVASGVSMSPTGEVGWTLRIIDRQVSVWWREWGETLSLYSEDSEAEGLVTEIVDSLALSGHAALDGDSGRVETRS